MSVKTLRTFFIIIFVISIFLPTSSKETANASSLSIVNGNKMAAINLPAADPIAATAAMISAGGSHTCALTASGGVKCWGYNGQGQLGDGTTTDRSTPVDVVDLTSGVSAVSAGGSHTCVLTTSGGVKCWGSNYSGQLGDGTTDNRSTPVDVAGLSSGVRAVSAGMNHTCALTNSGGVKCWGSNYYGQLGDGTIDNRSTPVDVVGLTSGISTVIAGGFHTCALTTSGGVKCWGNNYYGQLGDGTTDNRSTPVDVVGLTSGVSAISAGGDHTCALTTSGGVKCWGSNYSGQLGDGTTDNRLTPVDVTGLTSGIKAVSAGGMHTCALTTSGGVKCWGDNFVGQLGDGTTNNRSTPGDIVDLINVASIASSKGNHTCAVIPAGGIKCWGENFSGQLGDGTTANRSTPVDVAGLTSGVSAVSSGESHTCALTTSGGVKCWGYNDAGQLGDGTTTSRSTSVDTVNLTNGVSAVSTGVFHTCALTSSDGVKCWGNNSDGQLGDGTTVNRLTQVDVVGLMNGVDGISVGGFHTCALTATGGVKCWGSNIHSQLGDGTTTNRSPPVDVTGLTSGVSAVSAGKNHTCALTTSGGVKCWGNNNDGQLGNNSTIHSAIPVDVVGLTSGVSAISAGGDHTCALTTTGGIKCWGDNYLGSLGDGTTTDRSTPVDVVGLAGGVNAVSAGGLHTCALTTSGGVKCWGNNYSGQLGDGTTTDRSTPVDVVDLASGVSAVSAGGFHTCALTNSGGAQCWGNNLYGQLGWRILWLPVDVVGFGADLRYKGYLPVITR
jgi:alpha-tubulin suppressor-like RCC1 family protein